MAQRLSVHEVRSTIAASLHDGAAKVERTAALLGTSPRTLQRWLQENGTSHSELADDARYEKARRLLRNPHRKISDIAAAIGFADPSSFSRAFARWSGIQPKAYRTGMLMRPTCVAPDIPETGKENVPDAPPF